MDKNMSVKPLKGLYCVGYLLYIICPLCVLSESGLPWLFQWPCGGWVEHEGGLLLWHFSGPCYWRNIYPLFTRPWVSSHFLILSYLLLGCSGSQNWQIGSHFELQIESSLGSAKRKKGLGLNYFKNMQLWFWFSLLCISVVTRTFILYISNVFYITIHPWSLLCSLT